MGSWKFWPFFRIWIILLASALKGHAKCLEIFSPSILYMSTWAGKVAALLIAFNSTYCTAEFCKSEKSYYRILKPFRILALFSHLRNSTCKYFQRACKIYQLFPSNAVRIYVSGWVEKFWQSVLVSWDHPGFWHCIPMIDCRRDGAMTALLSGVVLVLVLCHTPKTIVNSYESYQVRRCIEMRRVCT